MNGSCRWPLRQGQRLLKPIEMPDGNRLLVRGDDDLAHAGELAVVPERIIPAERRLYQRFEGYNDLPRMTVDDMVVDLCSDADSGERCALATEYVHLTTERLQV
jgi:hypothetical protein